MSCYTCQHLRFAWYQDPPNEAARGMYEHHRASCPEARAEMDANNSRQEKYSDELERMVDDDIKAAK